MMLTPGARLGPYEIVSPLGAGGMGEVYKARDLRLDRTVAIKVLPADVAGDPELRGRFEREARAIAALDHPHICAIYDVGEAANPEPRTPNPEPIRYLVMQHLEGETLADRLGRSQDRPLPLPDALKIAIEIADALDKAHRAGITHRDVKPANIFLVRRGGASAPPEAKLLDFGLAKLRGPAAPISMSGMTRLATPTPNTAHGTILGTVHYMAPEQVEGKEADARSDIWALGAVIYEMATGGRPFDGASPASVIGAILKDQPPPISTRQPLAPPALDHVVGRCLEKEAEERWQTAADLMRELRWVGASRPGGSEPTRSSSHRLLGWIAAALVAVTAVAVFQWMIRSSRQDPAAAPVLRFSISPPSTITFASPPATLPSTQLALSPDGQSLVFAGEASGGESMLWIRRLDAVAAQPIAGTEDATYPFWSPDSRAIAFFAKGKLKKIDTAGGPAQTLCDVADARGGTWGANDIILLSSNQTPIQRVSANGGVPVDVTKLLPSETGHRWPSFLADGRHFLYYARPRSAGIEQPAIYSGSLNDTRTKRLFGAQYAGAYVPSGHILFLSNGMLMAQPFDAAKLEVTGEPTLVARDVGGSTVNYASFSASSTGLLAFAGATVSQAQLAWFKRDGTLLAQVGRPGDYADVQLSPDNRRAVVTRIEPTGVGNLWIIDLASGQFSPLTFDPSISASPVWSPDGAEIVFRSNRNLPGPMFRRLASGAGSEQMLLAGTGAGPDAGNLFPTDWSADGMYILFSTASPKSSYDVWVMPLVGDRKPQRFISTPAADIHGRFSPDGRFVAYSSAESGRPQIYVQPFPASAGRWQVSIDGGSEPRWRADGGELFFIGPDRRLMAAPVQTSSGFQSRPALPLFLTRAATVGNPFRTSYAASRDGQRFLINTVGDNSTPPSITVVANWTALLKK